MSNQTMSLTPEEVWLAEARRADLAREKAIKEVAVEFLRTAHAYLAWLTENGKGTSYTTFCDEFAYTPPSGFPVGREAVYDAILVLFNTVRLEAELKYPLPVMTREGQE